MRKLSVIALMLGSSLAAQAQTASPQMSAQNRNDIETVIVTGTRTPDALAHDMIRSMAAPSPLLGTLARWGGGLCPRTDGLSSRTLNNYVTKRIREVTALAGAPLANEPCRSNLEIVFTDDPQAVLNAVRQANSAVLGYHPATAISHPIQAWYVTGTVDIRGRLEADHDAMGDLEYTNGGPTINVQTGAPQGFLTTFGIPMANIEGWKFKPEVSSAILGAFIIADSRETADKKLGPVADYIAMLALARTEAYGKCLAITSIANLMGDCGPSLIPDRITAADLGYLRGVYKMDPGAALQVQQNQIAAEMAKTIMVTSGP